MHNILMLILHILVEQKKLARKKITDILSNFFRVGILYAFEKCY